MVHCRSSALCVNFTSWHCWICAISIWIYVQWILKFLFDPLTVNVLFFQLILFYAIALIYQIVGGGFKREPLGILFTPWIFGSIPYLLGLLFINSIASLRPMFIYSITLEEAKMIGTRVLTLVFSYLLAIGSLFVPFYNSIFNVVFFLYFFIGGQLTSEDYHIDIALFNIENIKKIQGFLHDKK